MTKFHRDQGGVIYVLATFSANIAWARKGVETTAAKTRGARRAWPSPLRDGLLGHSWSGEGGRAPEHRGGVHEEERRGPTDSGAVAVGELAFSASCIISPICIGYIFLYILRFCWMEQAGLHTVGVRIAFISNSVAFWVV